MNSGHFHRKLIVAAAIFGLAHEQTFSGELTPYNLPSQQRPIEQSGRPNAQQNNRPIVDEAYYEKFSREARALSPSQRDQLLKTFTQNVDKALKAGRVDEAKHYTRLLKILQEK